jgi:hypothetical protein
MTPIWTSHLEAIQAGSDDTTAVVYGALSGYMFFDIALMISIERAAVIYYF